ncbi:hypothetical protein HAD_02565 [Hyphomonas adhaerens MHS-3]|uniref:Uncharacterized protein n=1 Tax=Hyphomonas adhaerens MHS-3 TaxID=1280949 RepID=A0A069E8Q2_9PROT|nr:TrbC/VirB2 family protein [Hyphomonas adhaerens]KCZ84526.1 hypothetical protein HAD_02565 [Hyphomonas adhaerens MHS-3]
MADERLLQAIQQLEELGVDFESSQDESEVRTLCDLTPDCREGGENSLVLNPRLGTFWCPNCESHGSFTDLVRLKEEVRRQRIHEMQPLPLDAEPIPDQDAAVPAVRPPVQDADFAPVPRRVSRNLAKQEAKVRTLGEADRLEERFPHLKPKEKKPFNGEKFIISLLALVFLMAGLAAASLSGFANYQAFSSSVADPLQSRIWGWTGVIAAVISFGGFTFFYWHTANHRMKEGWRALIFAIAGMGTSIIGTERYIAANNTAAAEEVVRADANRGVLESQIADWRRQLDGIPPETRSVEGLEAYLSEVERVGRTEQKPYRDAQNELGLAKRRDTLQAKIEAANAELLGQGSGNLLTDAQTRTNLPSWFFALMLEAFSSQGTSIGLVALLILYGRRRKT